MSGVTFHFIKSNYQRKKSFCQKVELQKVVSPHFNHPVAINQKWSLYFKHFHFIWIGWIIPKRLNCERERERERWAISRLSQQVVDTEETGLLHYLKKSLIIFKKLGCFTEDSFCSAKQEHINFQRSEPKIVVEQLNAEGVKLNGHFTTFSFTPLHSVMTRGQSYKTFQVSGQIYKRVLKHENNVLT